MKNTIRNLTLAGALTFTWCSIKNPQIEQQQNQIKEEIKTKINPNLTIVETFYTNWEYVSSEMWEVPKKYAK